MLTEKDLDEIEKIIEKKIQHLPTKDEFFSKMDEVMGELQTLRQEQKLISHHLTGHEDRISTLEEIHPEGKHASMPMATRAPWNSLFRILDFEHCDLFRISDFGF